MTFNQFVLRFVVVVVVFVVVVFVFLCYFKCIKLFKPTTHSLE